MKTEKIECVVALAVLLWCLIVSSAQAETLRGSSESKAIENQSAVDQKTAPLSPSSIIPSPSELIGTPPENAPFVGAPNAPSVSKPTESPRVSSAIEPMESPSDPIGVLTIILAITVPLGFALGYAVRAGISARRHARLGR